MSGGKQITAEFDIEPAYQEKPQGSNTGLMSQPQSQSPTGKELCLHLTDHQIQDVNDRLLSQEDRFLGQYLLPTILQ